MLNNACSSEERFTRKQKEGGTAKTAASEQLPRQLRTSSARTSPSAPEVLQRQPLWIRVVRRVSDDFDREEEGPRKQQKPKSSEKSKK